MTDIVVTGMAWHTALGHTLPGVWRRLLDGDSGIAPVASTYPLKNDRAARVALTNRTTPPDVRDTLDHLTRRTLAAAADHAQLDLSRARSRDAARTLLIVGTSFGARLDDARSAAEPLERWIDAIGAESGLETVALSTACSSGSDALLLGAELIRAGLADRCICGGADVLADSKRLAHSALGTMSATILRSFDQRHDGTILGEGVGFLVLERRGARPSATPLAVLRGAGSSNDAAGLTAPDSEGNGIRLAVERSLTCAGLRHADIGLINAHGSGTLTNDRIESTAYQALFGGSPTPPTVFATKGAFGHTLGATGALEAIATILALQHRVVPPICGLDTPLEGFDLPLPVREPRAVDAACALSLTIGFGGFNTSLIFSTADAR
ncbi:beta-ketoacyl-[acyl-carrier-protein] synthase family protein [Paraburkholderia sp.]|uniref:beta-ketoacyl-[acyl-carrier-protein] synthase family protein n=1 Tax=Paraburkholderia sp. TaxID=1926495 RepID=UPI00238BBA93|nr:beta-ketoacyl-[acyl-carrier-protein] synthase family protein [Paraburkholderia sp.]MDE1180641.1 beta-ketoacyl-[acyl-carrier-protein] synthase family protein [Paraburkholderia sp.]